MERRLIFVSAFLMYCTQEKIASSNGRADRDGPIRGYAYASAAVLQTICRRREEVSNFDNVEVFGQPVQSGWGYPPNTRLQKPRRSIGTGVWNKAGQIATANFGEFFFFSTRLGE
jgi:hypothetical protein